jgi:micrococcal nuclease
MKRIVFILAVALLPLRVEAATLHASLPSHVRAAHAAPAPLRNAAHVRWQPRLGASPHHRVGVRVHSWRYARRGTPSVTQAAGASHQTVTPGSIHVHDGDTFYVGPEAIRLRGIDTPELGQPGAAAATQRLIALLHSGPVTIVRRAEDAYGRIVADVYVGGVDVARTLLAEGYAKPR